MKKNRQKKLVDLQAISVPKSQQQQLKGGNSESIVVEDLVEI